MSESLDYLFPVPSLAPSRLSPGHSPGVSPESTEALQNVLKDNHVKWHIFFNDLHFHNHASHRVIAAWALGADADTIRNAYERDCGYQKPAIKSPELISVDNFNEHLGDDRYFDAYIQYFLQHVKEKGIGPTIEEFVFAREANLGRSLSQAGERQPEMLNRFFAGVLHPAIHTGYSAEFSLPGMLVEGLAQVAVHHPVPGLLEPLLLFESCEKLSNTPLGSTQSQFATPINPKTLPIAPDNQTAPGPSKKDDPHALTILARVLRDPKFRPSPADRNDSGYEKTINQHSEDIALYVNAWNIDPDMLEGRGWETKVEEITWTVVVLYGIAGWTYGKGKPGGFLADFFLMHLVTSSIFLPSLCALISPVSRSRLLKTYLAVSCIWAVARGQPRLDVEGFIEATNESTKLASTGKGDLWDKILEQARVHHDEHMTKIIRSLSGWASVFGTRRARLPLKKKPVDVSSSAKMESLEHPNSNPGLSIDTDDVESKKQRNGVDDFLMERNVVESSFPHRDWHSSRSNVRRKSNDAELSPGSWRDAVNEGDMASQVRRARSERPQVHQSVEAHNTKNEADYLPSTELPGSEYLDGSLFLRVVVLTLRRSGWDFEKGQGKEEEENKEEEEWDYQGFL